MTEEEDVRSVLNRLAGYYRTRAEVALKSAQRSIDTTLTISLTTPLDADPAIIDILAAQRWQTRYQTVLKVAENLEIKLSEG
jgi:hypothetical protein